MRLARARVRTPALRLAPAALAAAVLVSGCHVPGTGGSGTASGSGPITVGVVPGIDNVPLRVAVQDGLFQQHGLTVTVRTYPSLLAEYQALVGGQVQIAVGDYTDFLYEQAQNPGKLRLIADEYDAASDSVAILTLPSSHITQPAQLENQPGGIATLPAQVVPFSDKVPYSIETLAAEEVLQNDGVSPSSLTWARVPAQEMLAELHNGQVKAILATEPYILEAEQQLGAVVLVNASSGVTSGLPMSGYFSLSGYAHANPSAVQAFQAALDQAEIDCSQRGLVQTVLPQLTGMSQGDAALITLGTYPGSLNTGQVQRVASLMYDSGLISTPLDVSRMTSG